jgi:hypothetical protein
MALEKEWLRKYWVDQGLSRNQIVDLYKKETGETITPPAVSVAVRRFNLPQRGNRWKDLIPWRVGMKHQDANEVKLLRAAGRRRAGLKNSPALEQKLDSWLEELERNGRPVVAYYPDTEDGFTYHPRVPEDGDGEWDLIRRPEVQELLDRKAAG